MVTLASIPVFLAERASLRSRPAEAPASSSFGAHLFPARQPQFPVPPSSRAGSRACRGRPDSVPVARPRPPGAGIAWAAEEAEHRGETHSQNVLLTVSGRSRTSMAARAVCRAACLNVRPSPAGHRRISKREPRTVVLRRDGQQAQEAAAQCFLRAKAATLRDPLDRQA